MITCGKLNPGFEVAVDVRAKWMKYGSISDATLGSIHNINYRTFNSRCGQLDGVCWLYICEDCLKLNGLEW